MSGRSGGMVETKEEGEEEVPLRLSLASYNDHKDARLADIIDHVLPQFDIICFQEMFRRFSTRQRLLLLAAHKTGHRHVVVSEEPYLSSLQIIDGGLVILSRWPILAHDQVAYAPGVNADFFAAKGALYAKVRISRADMTWVPAPVSHVSDTAGGPDMESGGAGIGAENGKEDGNGHAGAGMADGVVELEGDAVILHVFNTHLQASYDSNQSNAANDAVRQKQLENLQAFIQRKAEACVCTETEYILLTGDLNVDGRHKMNPAQHSAGYEDMLKSLAVPGYRIRDLLHESQGEHHVTVGDATPDVVAGLLPRETILTGRKDHCCMKRLDYMLLYEPVEEEADVEKEADSEDEAGEDAEPLMPERVVKLTTASSTEWRRSSTGSVRRVQHSHSRVEPFFINDRPYTQLSDHYAVTTEFHVLGRSCSTRRLSKKKPDA